MLSTTGHFRISCCSRARKHDCNSKDRSGPLTFFLHHPVQPSDDGEKSQRASPSSPDQPCQRSIIHPMADSVFFCGDGDLLGCYEPSDLMSFLDLPIGPSPLSPSSEHEYPPPPPVDDMFYGGFPAGVPDVPPRPAPSVEPYFSVGISSPSEEVLNIGYTGYGCKRRPQLRRYVCVYFFPGNSFFSSTT